VGAGFDPQIGAAGHMGVEIGPRRTPAFAVLLRHLVDAEAFVIPAVEILADAELALARALQEDLLHRVVGAQFVDRQRAALAVIFAVEIGIVFRALEVGQHVGERPAGVAQRGPLIVVAAVAADIDHGVDGGRTTEALAARLIADAAVEAGLRHGVEGPVVDIAGDHQHQRERRGHHPIVVLAAGVQRRHRGLWILRKPARHRAAAGAAPHHHKIKCIRHACFPRTFCFRHCEPPGRANARPMINSAKQSMGPQSKMDCFVTSLLAMTAKT
jgi:hypothetical protein